MDFASGLLIWFANTAISTIVGNVADEKAKSALQAVARAFRGKEDAPIPIQAELQRAVARTFITAQISIAAECREECLGVQEKKYRGQPDYPQEHRADLLWLDRKVEDLNRALKDDPFTALPNLETQSGLVTNDGESLSNVTATSPSNSSAAGSATPTPNSLTQTRLIPGKSSSRSRYGVEPYAYPDAKPTIVSWLVLLEAKSPRTHHNFWKADYSDILGTYSKSPLQGGGHVPGRFIN